jgi:hypothetical protein
LTRSEAVTIVGDRPNALDGQNATICVRYTAEEASMDAGVEEDAS